MVVMTCMIRAGQGAAGRGGGAFDLVSQGTWEKFTIELTQTVPEKLKEVILWGGDRVAKNKFRVFVGAIIAAGVGIGMAAEGIEIPPKLKYVSQWGHPITPILAAAAAAASYT